MSRVLSFLLIAAAALTASLALTTRSSLAGAVSSGTKTVEHVLVFEGLPALESHDFWLVAAREDAKLAPRRIQEGAPLPFTSKEPLRVVAVPTGVALDAGIAAPILSPRVFKPNLEARVASGIERRETRVRLFKVQDEAVYVRVVDFREFDDEGRQVNGRVQAVLLGKPDMIGLGIAGGLLLIGVAIARRRPERLA